jgi:hypothetical protein
MYVLVSLDSWSAMIDNRHPTLKLSTESYKRGNNDAK